MGLNRIIKITYLHKLLEKYKTVFMIVCPVILRRSFVQWVSDLSIE